MQSIIQFLANLEFPIYLILGVVAIVYLRRLSIAVEERRSSIFGLEREVASQKVTSAVTVLVLVGLLVIGEFIVSTFLVSEIPQTPSYATPTIEVLTTPTTTLPVSPAPTDATPTPTRYPQAEIQGVTSNCMAGVLEITEPKQGDEVSGVVSISGSVNTPNFGSYEYDYSAVGEISWNTIAAGSGVVMDANLGNLFTANLVPGDYLLRLLALDNNGIETQACVIQVKVVPEE